MQSRVPLGIVYWCGACCEPVWPNGKALGRQAEGFRFDSASALLSLPKLLSVDTVLRLCLSQLMKY